MDNWLYHTNMCIKYLINRIKIDGFRALRRGPENGPKFLSQIFVPNFGAENFPTDCYGEKNRYERRPLGFMKKMNGGLYRVTRFARDNKRLKTRRFQNCFFLSFLIKADMYVFQLYLIIYKSLYKI